MITRYRDTVELWSELCSICEDILDDAHRFCRRVDVRIADHIFLQNVILNSACHNRRNNSSGRWLEQGMDKGRR